MTTYPNMLCSWAILDAHNNPKNEIYVESKGPHYITVAMQGMNGCLAFVRTCRTVCVTLRSGDPLFHTQELFPVSAAVDACKICMYETERWRDG